MAYIIFSMAPDLIQSGLPVVGYTRVSTEEQGTSGAGLAAQRATIEAEAQRRGWVLANVYEDASASGRSLAKRPGLAAAIGELEAGRAKALMVSKLDRLTRSVKDFAELLERFGRRGWALVVLDLGVDSTTPTGEAMANVMATFAQFERRLIGQRTKEALAQKRAQGVQLGRRPTTPPDVDSLILRLRRKGLSLAAIAEELNRLAVPTPQGGEKWRASSLQSAIKRLAAPEFPRGRRKGPGDQR